MELIGLLVPAVLAGIGWLIAAIWNNFDERRKIRQKTKLDYIERQIEELYGPLFNLVIQIVTINHVRFGVVSNASPGDRVKIDQMFYGSYFRPLHEEAVALLKSRVHLVEGGLLPKSFYEYLRHAMQERIQQDLWNIQKIDTSMVAGVRYPDAFSNDVQMTLENLLKRHGAIEGRYADG